MEAVRSIYVALILEQHKWRQDKRDNMTMGLFGYVKIEMLQFTSSSRYANGAKFRLVEANLELMDSNS